MVILKWSNKQSQQINKGLNIKRVKPMRRPIFAPILKNLGKWGKTEKEQSCTIVAILTIRH